MLRAPETCRGREDKEKERTGNTLQGNTWEGKEDE